MTGRENELEELALRLERERAEAVVDRDRWKAEADRLRKLFDAAGQGEHNVLALVDHYQREAFDSNEALDLAFEMGRQKGRDQERADVLRYLREQLPITGRSIAFYLDRGDHLKEWENISRKPDVVASGEVVTIKDGKARPGSAEWEGGFIDLPRLKEKP